MADLPPEVDHYEDSNESEDDIMSDGDSEGPSEELESDNDSDAMDSDEQSIGSSHSATPEQVQGFLSTVCQEEMIDLEQNYHPIMLNASQQLFECFRAVMDTRPGQTVGRSSIDLAHLPQAAADRVARMYERVLEEYGYLLHYSFLIELVLNLAHMSEQGVSAIFRHLHLLLVT